jgi:uncharacterized peroxidase-related enzyme
VEHANDLRAEVAEQGERGAALVESLSVGDPQGTPDLSDADRAMLAFALKLAREPWSMKREDTEALRAAGFDDTAIHDIVQITGFFSYYNRLADGLGIDPEP